MPSWPLDSTHGRTTSSVACHHRHWEAHMDHTRSNNVGRAIPSSPLGSKDGQTTSCLTFHHSPWTIHTVGRRRALHAIIAFEKHTRSDDVGRSMPSSPLGSTHGRTTSTWNAIIVVGQHIWSDEDGRGTPSSPLGSTKRSDDHTRSDDVGLDMPSWPLDSTQGRMTSGVACLHCLWTAHTVIQRRPWHAIMALSLHTQSDVVGLGMPS
uniref:Uncharacterized protein n=1 Tax=Solanum lycopersicum TaxID=4081 RepID=A0A3Q7EYF6_SOLLC